MNLLTSGSWRFSFASALSRQEGGQSRGSTPLTALDRIPRWRDGIASPNLEAGGLAYLVPWEAACKRSMGRARWEWKRQEAQQERFGIEQSDDGSHTLTRNRGSYTQPIRRGLVKAIWNRRRGETSAASVFAHCLLRFH